MAQLQVIITIQPDRHVAWRSDLLSFLGITQPVPQECKGLSRPQCDRCFDSCSTVEAGTSTELQQVWGTPEHVWWFAWVAKMLTHDMLAQQHIHVQFEHCTCRVGCSLQD